MTISILFAALALLIIVNVPVGIALGISSMLAIICSQTSLTLLSLVQSLVISCDSFPILAIPMFILAGDLMSAGGVSSRILNVCNVFFGRVTGGLAIVTVLVCMFFAAVSGSGPATVAAIGTMVIPTMLKQGYSKQFVLALVATAGSIGVIIPPSIPMVIFGVATSFTKIIMVEQMPAMITQGFLNITSSGVILLILINILLLIVGCFMDTTPAILVLAPILMPIAQAIGLDPVHFGLIMVVNLAIGFTTPPLGINLFVASRIANSPIETILKGIMPFLLIMIANLMIISFVPPIVMFLPNL